MKPDPAALIEQRKPKLLDHWLPCPADGWVLTFSQAEKLRRKWLRDRARQLREAIHAK